MHGRPHPAAGAEELEGQLGPGQAGAVHGLGGRVGARCDDVLGGGALDDDALADHASDRQVVAESAERDFKKFLEELGFDPHEVEDYKFGEE